MIFTNSPRRHTDYPRIGAEALNNPEGPWGDKIVELFEAVDTYIPEPIRATENPS
ncbi:hypothetical protein MASR2M70_10130 [Bacillota bacterium]